MKLVQSLLLATVADLVYAASEALIYLNHNGRSSMSSQATLITPNTGRLLLAQRLDLSQYHELGDADAATLNVLNENGRPWQSFLGSQDQLSKMLLIIEGVKHPEGSPHSKTTIARTTNRSDRSSTAASFIH